MRAITGTTETPGDADNPKILAMRDEIKRIWGDVSGMAPYCDTYQHDSQAWCGLTVGFCMSEAGFMPAFGPAPVGTDDYWYDKFYWAKSWAEDSNYIELSAPVPGCIVVMGRDGGGHVTLYERTSGSNYVCRGGNQSDAINEQSYPISNVIALMWPKDEPVPPVPPAERRELARGDVGADVASVQKTLGIPADGDFGPVTEAAVKGFQGAVGLAKDGEVGPNTWGALDELERRLAAGNDGISDQLAEAIDRTVADYSDVQAINWPDRGRPPPGYYAGLAKTFALAATRLNGGDPAARVMAAAESGDPDTDALTWYADEFAQQGMPNDASGINTLRHLFVLMFGLGMRESSGNCWEGRDMSASNTSSDTAEAGLFQTSWNISSCSGEIDNLLAEYEANPNGFQPTFARGINPTTSNLDNYGSGEGCLYQFLAKRSPAFATLVTAIGLRKLRQHWGPINRYEVDLMPAVDDMLIEVQRLTDVEPEPEPPEPDDEPAEVRITVASKGNVKVIVNQY
jgi:uncharacterized protein (TIGR02594 family)